MPIAQPPIPIGTPVFQYFRNVEECEWALECLASTGLPVFADLCIGITHTNIVTKVDTMY